MEVRKKRQLTEFGVSVKKKLVELGMTQKELSEQLGCGDVYLNIILHGQRSGKKYLSKIRKLLDI